MDCFFSGNFLSPANHTENVAVKQQKEKPKVLVEKPFIVSEIQALLSLAIGTLCCTGHSMF